VPNFTIVALKMWAYSPKNREIVIFGINLHLKESSGVHRKSTNLPACNDTTSVLKITLLHSVSVITNFVIPKRNRQTKNITLFRLQPARDPRSSPYWHGDRGGPFHFCPPQLFDPISSLAAMGYRKFVRKYPQRRKMLITWLFVA